MARLRLRPDEVLGTLSDHLVRLGHPTHPKGAMTLQELAGVRVPDYHHRQVGRHFSGVFMRLRKLFGPGDNSLVGSVVAQLMLGGGTVYLLTGERRRGIYQMNSSGRVFTVEFFVRDGPYVMNPRGEEYFEMVEFQPHQLTPVERERIEYALLRDESAARGDLLRRFRASLEQPIRSRPAGTKEIRH